MTQAEAQVALAMMNELKADVEAGKFFSMETVHAFIDKAFQKGPMIFNIIKAGAAALGATFISKGMAMIQNLSKQAKFIMKVIRHPKQITRAETIGFLKTLPFIGTIVKIVTNVEKLADRALHGDKEACYRKGLSVRKSFKMHGHSLFHRKKNPDKCNGPGDILEKKRCYKPCPKNKSPNTGITCIGDCPIDFPAKCGMLCYATKAQCEALKVHAAADVIGAASTIAQMATGVGLINILGFIDKALQLLDNFAHPRCSYKD